MSEKVKAKLIEIDKTELKADSKYLILLRPDAYAAWAEPLHDELSRLVGANFTIAPLDKDQIHIYEIMK